MDHIHLERLTVYFVLCWWIFGEIGLLIEFFYRLCKEESFRKDMIPYFKDGFNILSFYTAVMFVFSFIGFLEGKIDYFYIGVIIMFNPLNLIALFLGGLVLFVWGFMWTWKFLFMDEDFSLRDFYSSFNSSPTCKVKLRNYKIVRQIN